MSRGRWRRFFGVLVVVALVAAACGGSSDSDETTGDEETEGGATTTVAIATTVAESGGDEEGDTEEETGDVAPASGTLRMVEFSPVTTFDPAGAQAAQSMYLYGEYDTLTRQNADYGLEPAMATAWEQPDPNSWVFTLREDITFHDGSPFNGEVAAANMLYHQAFDGNPNAVTWANLTSAEATGEYEVTATFSVPQPQFAIQMSMVMGMMISGEAITAGEDLTRNPAGSGPWQWSEDESVAGVTEIYNAVDGYWNPADQGVERIEVTSVPDNSARLNALLTEEADIMGTIRDPQVEEAESTGGTLSGAPNYFPYLVITDREGAMDEPLGDPLVREAIGLAIDRDAYTAAIHAGRAESTGGIYPAAFAEWFVPELDDSPTFDQERARELLAEAGYPDGLTLNAPIMPVIQPHVELVNQMLAAVGITVEQIQINNGELGPRTRAGDWGISWLRDLLYHPANDLPKFVDVDGPLNPFGLTDMKDLSDMLVEAAGTTDVAEQQAIYAEVETEMIDRGLLIPLGHATTQAFVASNVTGTVQGLNMQAPMPYGVRVDG